MLDIEYEANNDLLDLEKLIETHNKKTGRLISFSILGAILLSGNEEKVVEYADFGKNIGLAFQIKDDLLDVEGSFEQTGKSVAKNSHEYEQKGFVHFLGLKDTKKYLEEVTEKSLKNIENLESQKLNFLVTYIATRSK